MKAFQRDDVAIAPIARIIPADAWLMSSRAFFVNSGDPAPHADILLSIYVNASSLGKASTLIEIVIEEARGSRTDNPNRRGRCSLPHNRMVKALSESRLKFVNIRISARMSLLSKWLSSMISTG